MQRRLLVAFAAFIVIAPGCALVPKAPPRMDPILYAEPQSGAITFWGHACAYIDVGRYGIITDPVFAGRWVVVRHRLIPVPPPDAYDETRLILISHAHHDHLDPETLSRFPRDAVILAPAPAAKFLQRRGIHARVMKPGSEFPIPGGTVVAVAAYHPGGRFAVKPHADGRALGYVIRTGKGTIYYSGDTDYFPGFSVIGAKYHPDIALINVNKHLHSREALSAIWELRAETVIPLHYGAYDGPSYRLAPRWHRELIRPLGGRVVLLGVGESMPIPPGR